MWTNISPVLIYAPTKIDWLDFNFEYEFVEFCNRITWLLFPSFNTLLIPNSK